MDLLSITLYENLDSTTKLVDMILKNYGHEDLEINSEVVNDGKFNTINFYIDEDFIKRSNDQYDEWLNEFNHHAAIGISNYIVDILEIKIVEKILYANYYFLKANEKRLIIEQLNKCFDNEIYDRSIDVPYKVNRKAKILYRLLDFLDESSNINIEGFVNFRLRNYIEDLYEIIDRVIEEYVMEKEYKEFIKLLKYFVDIQESKVELINIVVDKTGMYHFFDEGNNLINDEYIRGLIADLVDSNLNNDDMLVSTLITIAPKKIVFHSVSNVKNTEIIETIKNIFDGKVYTCNNCRLCNMNRIIKEE